MIGLTRILVVVLVMVTNTAMVVVESEPTQATRSSGGKFLQIVGQVSVNGTSAISGATVFSESTITTAARSSAVVSLGKLWSR